MIKFCYSQSSKSGSDSGAADIAAVKALPADQQLDALITRYSELAAQNAQVKVRTVVKAVMILNRVVRFCWYLAVVYRVADYQCVAVLYS